MTALKKKKTKAAKTKQVEPEPIIIEFDGPGATQEQRHRMANHCRIMVPGAVAGEGAAEWQFNFTHEGLIVDGLSDEGEVTQTCSLEYVDLLDILGMEPVEQ